MADFEELAERQRTNGEAIQRIISNYKKDASTRKTSASYYKERLVRLEEAWAVFEATDDDIRGLPSLPLSHDYFIKDYFNKLKVVYEQYHDYFTEKKEYFEQTAQQTVPMAKVPDELQASQVPLSKGAISKGSIMPQLSKQDENSDLVKAIRGQIRAIECLRRLLKSLITDSQPKSYYELKIRTINHQWTQIEEYDRSIWELSEDPTSKGYNLQSYLELEEQTQQCLISLSTNLEGLSAQPQQLIPQANICNTALPRLPKLILPQFDGDYSRWRQFYDLFMQLVHNQAMSNCQKMWYLKTNLTGEAERLLRHFTLSEENYNSAWQMLQDRYNNKRLLVAALINKLLSQPSHSNDSSSAANLKALHDTTQECLLGLQNLNIPINGWDPLLLHILINKLDKVTHMLYEQTLSNPKELQTLKEFLAFIENRFQSLEALGVKAGHLKRQGVSKTLTSVVSTGQNKNNLCPSCKGNHALFSCKGFLKLTPSNRLNFVRRHDLCVNCLKPGHNANKCSLRGCTKCNRRHNTLVHLEISSKSEKSEVPELEVIHDSSATTTKSSTSEHAKDQSVMLAALRSPKQQSYVLLGTAKIKLITNEGHSLECRALLDSGSQINLITEKVVKKLALHPRSTSMLIQGIGRGERKSQQRINVQLESRLNGFKATLEAFVLPHIISPQPTQFLDISTWPIPKNIKLADERFNHPDRIDVLLGAEYYHQLLSVGQIRMADELPTLQNTVFGWILIGKIHPIPSLSAACCIGSGDETNHLLKRSSRLEDQIEKFWTIEEPVQSSKNLTLGEKLCEDHFTQTVRRDRDGRFKVRLPFLEKPIQLGESRDIAFRRFLSMERKLNKDYNLRKQYSEFMQEYLRLGHMEEIDLRSIQAPYYFLPHHCVLKPGSSTTKLRVVFDGSCKTSKNISLNDILAAGPIVQDELFTILLRFRMPRFVFTADIEKMFRQVLVHEDDRKYQLIFWRSSTNEPVKCYRLNTVTYGTKPATYLATKCLERLAQDTDKYPLGSEALKRDFYVDDIMSGSDSLTTALQMQEQLRSLLAEGGFKLRKWCANHPRLLRNIPPEDVESHIIFNDGDEETIKILGLSWLPSSDSFCIKTTWNEQQRVTKRIASSDTARLFDPLGIMAPVVVTAKIFLQQLWNLKLDWDASLPLDLHTKWINFREGLKAINDIRFPRHVLSKQPTKSMQLHVFADASQRAYGAAVYVRSINKDNQIVARLLCAKSRVAPLRQITLPRLELCAAQLAAQLTERVKTDLRITKEAIFYWSDSEIVLSWINSSTTSFQTFVANRVSVIQGLSQPQQWRHVGSKQNPADILSRGLDPQRLENCNLWFYGPPFLHGTEEVWPPPFSKIVEDDSERKRVVLPLTSEGTTTHFVNRIEHQNSFRRLKRVVAYMLRFINKIKSNSRRVDAAQNPQLTAKELDEALMVIISVMQTDEFNNDIVHMRRYDEPSKNSCLTSLAPFLDEKGLIRVGGRLEASSLPYDAKHPLVLPHSHHLTKLLMEEIHLTNCHVGPQTLLSITQQRFWPIKGKTIARSIVHHCISCARAKPKLLSQIMGNLPAHRVQPARPFVNAGVDFCGPVWVHYKVRGKRPQKAYVAVFCCFATKATHLELVTDLSTPAFIGALKRFMGRRGRCRNIYCDNATNFIAARNELSELKQAIHSKKSKTDIARACEVKGTDFHFIPPRAPHFGGLWEAAVKSAKYLLRRTLRAASLTYEELETVVIEIEAILNSRPLTPMSSNPNDLSALTPGHFLIGEPLTSSIDANAEPTKAKLLVRWKLVSYLKNKFWERWSHEYLNQLQHRHKWNEQQKNVQPGTLVIIEDDNLPPLKWPLGRITKVIKGRDGFARVADVRIANHNIIRRPIHRLAPLPINDDEGTGATELENDKNPQQKGSGVLKDARDSMHKRRPTSQNDPQQKRPRVSRHTQNSTSEATPTPQKRGRRSLGSAITMLLLALLVLPSAKGLPVEIKPFDSHPGIHFENLGTTYLVNTQWNLVVYYDLEPYWMEFKMFYSGTIAQRSVCDLMQQRKICNSVITQFAHLKEKLSNDNELLQPRITRAKRSPFNIVGNMASALFGVLDSDYAERMSQTIENVKINENHLLTLIQNQTSLLDSTLNVIRGNQAVMRNQFAEFNDHIDQLRNRMNNMSQEIHESSLSQLFVALSLQNMLLASNLQHTQTSILEVIADTHHGRISPQLLSPQQLREALVKIKEHLPSSLRLPIGLNDTPRLYNIMNIQCQVTSKHVIFKLDLPLPSIEEFELFRLIPVPVLINNTLLAIKPSSPLLVVNLHRDQYYQLDEQELAACVSIEEGTHMCRQTHPIYRRGADIGACEIHLMNQLPQPRTCQLIRIETSSQWTQLHEPNKWIYALQGKGPITIVCGDKVSQTMLEGSGILKIQNGCVIKQGRITIQGHNYYPSVTKMSYTPMGNITDFISHNEEVALIQPNSKVYQPDQAELEKLQGRLNEQKLQLPAKIEAHDVHQFTVGYLGLLGIVIIGGLFIWKCITTRTRNGPVPAPRRPPNEDFSVHIEPNS